MESALARWEKKKFIVLFCEVAQVLCKSICNWVGVPLKDEVAGKTAERFISIVDAFGSLGPHTGGGKKPVKELKYGSQRLSMK